MKKSTIVWTVIAIVLVLYGFSSYNGLVNKNEAVDNQWAQVETQYQRRFDLIPQLVSSVKGILKQEQTVFGEIAEARTRYSGAASVDAKVRAASDLESTFSRLLVVMEAYPQLQSSQNILSLQNDIAGTENRISVERKRFNDNVQIMNVAVKRFPDNIFAKIFGFHEREYLNSVSGADQAPKIEL